MSFFFLSISGGELWRHDCLWPVGLAELHHLYADANNNRQCHLLWTGPDGNVCRSRPRLDGHFQCEPRSPLRLEPGSVITVVSLPDGSG